MKQLPTCQSYLPAFKNAGIALRKRNINMALSKMSSQLKHESATPCKQEKKISLVRLNAQLLNFARKKNIRLLILFVNIDMNDFRCQITTKRGNLSHCWLC